MKISRLLAGTALALSMSSGAYAATMDGSFGGALLDPTTSLALLAVGTDIGNSGALVTSVEAGSDYAGVGLTGQPVVMPTFTASNGNALSFSISGYGSFAGTITLAAASGPNSSRTLDVYALGTWTPEVPGAYDTFDPSAASVTLTANQTGGSGSAISVSFTLSSPPAPPPIETPEPMSMALFGLGLAGLGVAMRRRA